MQPVPTNEYTLWLEPGREEQRKLQEIINDFAERAGTPVFKPHLTLLPGLVGDEAELIRHLQTIDARALLLSCAGVRAGDAYHKCLYLECAPSEQLTALRTEAQRAFAVAPADFYPHLSLAYGLEASPLREAFISELKNKNFTFTVRVLSLWHARGLPDEWRLAASRTLSNQ